jgi:hypothetical protein
MPWNYDDYEGNGNVRSADDLYSYNDQSDWHMTASGGTCLWCGHKNYDPFDGYDAEQKLCRGHLAEYLGESLDSLDRAEMQAFADMRDSGYLD